MVKDGLVVVAGRVETRPGRRAEGDAEIELRGRATDYVSRGGRKLAAALEHFGLVADGAVALDIGASTGGFTDCLLRAGARHVTAVDVGRDQLAASLSADSRVRALERTDARDLPPLDPSPDIVVVDVSFVRLRDVLPAVVAAAPHARWALVLLKPQFELRRMQVPRDGVIEDARVRNAVLLDFLAWAARHGICVAGSMASALTGGDGNQEIFMLLRPPWPAPHSDYDEGDGDVASG